MASKKMDKLTDMQRGVVNVLQSNAGRWMTARDIMASPHISEALRNTDSSHIGALMRRMPQKDSRVELDGSTITTRYRWNGGAAVGTSGAGCNAHTGRVVRVEGDGFTMLPKPGTVGDSEWILEIGNDNPSRTVNVTIGQMTDEKIVLDALMFYANATATTDPMNAVRAAFLAGRGEFFGGKSKRANRLDAVTKTKKPLQELESSYVRVAEPDTEEAARIPAIMPDDMSYREMVDKIQAAYKRCEFLYADAAKRAELGEDYFTRIAQGKIAQPPRATQERVYSAIFEDDSNGDFDDA